MALVLQGRVVPMSAADPAAVFDGRVFLDDNGLVEVVTPAGASDPPGYATAPRTAARLSPSSMRIPTRREICLPPALSTTGLGR